jgi:hypothetical protein
MPTWKDVTDIGLGLPQTEVSTWYRTPGMKVAGKGFLRLRAEAEGGLVVFCDLDRKDQLLRSGDPTFYTRPHYDGYGAILIDLKRVKRADLVHLVTESWRQRAPLKLLKDFDQQQAKSESSKTPTRPGRGSPKRPPPARKGS